MPEITLTQAMQHAGQHLRAGNLAVAEEIYRRILSITPSHADALHMLGIIAMQRARYEEAVQLLNRAIAINPDDGGYYINLGESLRRLDQFEAAITPLEKAVRLMPREAAAHYNLGCALLDVRQQGRAVAEFEETLRLNPLHHQAATNLANGLMYLGRIEEGIAAFAKAAAAPGTLPATDSNLVFALHWHPTADAQAIFQAHRLWNQRHAVPLKSQIQPHPNDRNPDRRLTIGYVSPDFCNHAVARNFLPLILSHDHREVEVFCYASVKRPDDITARMRACADIWRDIVDLTDEQATDLIRQDRIDILIDLAGHTGGGRLLIFARKPAPIQVTHQGYPDTTGMDTMDYRFTDAIADPPGQTEALHSETLVRLPNCAWVFEPAEESPPVVQRDTGAPITFGTFNNFPKVTDPMLRLWARLLLEVPDSRLVLKASALGDEGARQRIQQLLASAGITPDRLTMHHWAPTYAGHLALYGEMDIGLDTFPYHGTATTCEALWMGIPIVTLAGKTHVSRVGVSLLTSLGLTDLIARTEDEYIAIAARLAADRPRLAQLRGGMRDIMRMSCLLDGPAYAHKVETAFRAMWRKWCASGGMKL
jgi:protein O-GlcNAc transferase